MIAWNKIVTLYPSIFASRPFPECCIRMFRSCSNHLNHSRATADWLSRILYPPFGIMPIVFSFRKSFLKVNIHAEAIVTEFNSGSIPFSSKNIFLKLKQAFLKIFTSCMQYFFISSLKLNNVFSCTCCACQFKKTNRSSIFMVSQPYSEVGGRSPT